MYVRFVVDQPDPDSGRAMGIFQAVRRLREANELFEYERHLDERLRNWFGRHLQAPPPQASDSEQLRRPQAISWFKSSASQHISCMREYASLLDAHGIQVRRLTTDRPGYIVYADAYQVAAIPFRDTFARCRRV